MEIFTPPPPPETAHVSPDGGDRAEGTADAPFASIGRALRSGRPRIALAPGVYPEPEVLVSRAVTIEGPAAGGAVLDGHLFVAASGVTVRRLDVTGGIAVHLADDVLVASATVSAGRKDDAVSVVSSHARLEGLSLTCGPETCLQVTTSTVRVAGLVGRGEDSKRVARVETSSVSLRELDLSGGSITQLQTSDSVLAVRGATLSDSRGNGLAVLRGSRLDARGLRVRAARRVGVLVQAAEARIADSVLGSAGDISVGVAGARLDLASSTVAGSLGGALSLSAHAGRLAELRMAGGLVDHGPRDGVLVVGGRLVARGTRFRGEGPPAGPDGVGDAIVAHGVEATVDLAGVDIERPAGIGVVLTHDAHGTLSATVTDAGRGGVLVENQAVEPVRLDGVVVRGCRAGSGVTALAAREVRIVGGQVSGCSEAGYLAGQGATMHVEGAQAAANREYGFAAFGASTMYLEGVTASGGRWAAFAACGDGSRIAADPDSTLDGEVALCP